MGQILLVRHGQASWGADDYDVLSEKGHEQGRLLGLALAARQITPDVVVMGAMRRHRETWEAMAPAFGSAPEAAVDAGWDEFDHVSMLSKVPASFEGRKPTAAEFQAWFEEATDRWTAGGHDHDYEESFSGFIERVGEALGRTSELVGSGTGIVVSSGGPVSWATALLSDGGIPAWRKLNPVCANSGVTKVVTGRRGLTLVTFNEHTHLDATPELLTYR